MEIQSNTTIVDMTVKDDQTQTPMSVTAEESNQVLVISGNEDLISFDIKTAPPVGEIYTGTYIVTPLVSAQQELLTAHKTLEQNVIVREIPYSETHNADGITVYIGE